MAGGTRTFEFYEFFAGGGMARSGLGSAWTCLFSNDFDRKKSDSYRANWRGGELVTADVGSLAVADLPGRADLAWASFPCQDLSLAGGGAGLAGERSGTFWPFWRLMEGLRTEGRAPGIVVLENVCGTLTSHGGKDFATIGRSLRSAGYSFGAVIIDAALFVPQSRPRLFIVGVCETLQVPAMLTADGPTQPWHTLGVQRAARLVPADGWIWWSMPSPKKRRTTFADLIEDAPDSVEWHTPAETRKLLGMMSEVNREKVRQAQRTGERCVGTIYKRTRRDETGRKTQRAEVRFDGLAGCLRTPAGGSSRQLVVIVEGRAVHSRLMSSREAARLMGLADSYTLPDNYNEAYHLIGDGVAVPVVRHLAKNVLEPMLHQQSAVEVA